ncbi:ATP-binding protein, partial [Listeria innocua]|nr:ATP-binding protein [Listeria innocua]
MEEKEVILPPHFNRDTMYSVLKQCINESLVPTYKKIIFNLEHLRFIEPSGLTILSNTIEWLQLNKCDVSIQFKRYTSSSPTSENKKVMQFLNDIEFFSEYMDVEISEPLGKRRNTCPLELINYKDSVNWVRNSFIPWIGGILNVNVADLDYLQISLEEIFNNIADHSTVRTACISAQYFPRAEEIKICVSDFGVGIPASLRKKFPDLSDSELMKKATDFGVSSENQPHNRGAGIGNIIKAITNDNLGVVHLHS